MRERSEGISEGALLSQKIHMTRAGVMGANTLIPGGLDMTCLAAKTVAAEVRQRIDLRLEAWKLSHLAFNASLIAAELITNACVATPEDKIRICFRREPKCVVVGVWDSSDEMPRPQPVVELEPGDLDLSEEHFDDNGGWGLALVRELASSCGVTRTEHGGKWVWARLAI
jgi:anti-sigma regulatory factor (Ser/Thr protein kinase)